MELFVDNRPGALEGMGGGVGSGHPVWSVRMSLELLLWLKLWFFCLIFLFVCMYMCMHVCIYVYSVCRFTGISKARPWDTPWKHAYRIQICKHEDSIGLLSAHRLGIVVVPAPHSKSLVIPTCTLFAVPAVAKLWSMEHSRQLWPKQGEGPGGQRKKGRKVHWPDGSASKGACHQALISISRTHLVEGKMATSEVYKDE